MELGSIADWISAIAALVAVIGVWIAYKQTKEANLIAKSEFENTIKPRLKFVVTAITEGESETLAGFEPTKKKDPEAEVKEEEIVGYQVVVVNYGGSPASLNVVRSNNPEKVESNNLIPVTEKKNKIGNINPEFNNSVLILPGATKPVWYAHKNLKYVVGEDKTVIFRFFEEITKNYYLFELSHEHGAGYSLVPIEPKVLYPSKPDIYGTHYMM